MIVYPAIDLRGGKVVLDQSTTAFGSGGVGPGAAADGASAEELEVP